MNRSLHNVFPESVKKTQQSNFLSNIPIILRNFAKENLIKNGKKTRSF